MLTATRTQAQSSTTSEIAPKWSVADTEALLSKPLMDLLFQAHSTHRNYFDANAIQLSTLLNIKTGGCPEDCAYCPQSARYATGVEASALLSLDAVVSAAKQAKEAGASRFCMGAAWRAPKDRDLDRVVPLIEAVKDLGLESCVTLGMLRPAQAQRLKRAGLDYYNHNLDTSPEFYGEIISTRTYQDRLDTLAAVRAANINVCCGGIIGLGESTTDRAALLCELANLPEPPESVPINMLVRVEGTPLANQGQIDSFDMIRTVATARIMMPRAYVRLSAGRQSMNDEAQALCFFAGANSIFYGEQLLTTSNPLTEHDRQLFSKIGLEPSSAH
ncbi:MAG: biotin synthase BioB [Gammaproteobacteria bacterium]|nr:biotin synthase BioB [Gammaproteobacteria bacterium]